MVSRAMVSRAMLNRAMVNRAMVNRAMVNKAINSTSNCLWRYEWLVITPARWLLDDPCISLRAHASTGDGAAAVARACGMWEYSEVT